MGQRIISIYSLLIVLMRAYSSHYVAAFSSSCPSTTTRSIYRKQRPFLSQHLFLLSLQELEDKYLDMASQNQRAQPEIVYILMYNPGTEEEGVHTTEYPKIGSGSEVILGFQELGDCVQFATALKVNPDFPLEPVPTPAPFQQMQASVEMMGLSIMVVPPLS
jgi:hypothetical protein